MWPGCNLEVGEILHVRLGTTAPVEELVDVEDPHLVLPKRICDMAGAGRARSAHPPEHGSGSSTGGGRADENSAFSR